MNKKDIFIYIQLYFSPLQKLWLLRIQTIPNIYLCYKNFLVLCLCHQHPCMQLNLENNFPLSLIKKKTPLPTEEHDLRGVRMPATVNEWRVTSRKNTVSSPITPLPLCLHGSDGSWSLCSHSLFSSSPFLTALSKLGRTKSGFRITQINDTFQRDWVKHVKFLLSVSALQLT